VTSNNTWITTLAARFGVTNGSWLFYGKAGGGWVGNDDFTIMGGRRPDKTAPAPRAATSASSASSMARFARS
jgi:hypothetical protein